MAAYSQFHNIQISAVEPFNTEAGVAQLGQRRKTEALIPQGFVGSNPISRTVLDRLYQGVK